MPRPRLHDDQLRTRLLQHAGRLVTERGVGALSLRHLASQAHTSTTAVYSLFGGKQALLSALYEESFASFGAAQRAVRITGDTVADLRELGRAYWQWARRYPHLYGVMFGGMLTDSDYSPEQAGAAMATIEPLSAVVSAAVDSRTMAGDPATITFAIWASVHGVVSLVMAGCAPPEESVVSALFEATAMATVRGWLTGSVQPAQVNLART